MKTSRKRVTFTQAVKNFFRKKSKQKVDKKIAQRSTVYRPLIFLCRNSPMYMNSNVHGRINAKWNWIQKQCEVLREHRYQEYVRSQVQ